MKRVISNTDPETPALASPAGPPTESTVVNALPWKLKGRTQVFAADGKTPVAQFYTQADAQHCVDVIGAVALVALGASEVEPVKDGRPTWIDVVVVFVLGFLAGCALVFAL